MSSLYLFFGSLFSPIIGIVSLMLNIKKYIPSKFTTILLSFILSIIGIYWFPWGDAQTHFYSYSLDFTDLYFNFSSAALLSSYWLYDLVIAYFAKLTGNYVFGYFFWLFIPLVIFSYAVWDKYLKSGDTSKYIMLFVLLYTMLGVREFLDLNRSTAASLLFVSSLILKDQKAFGRIISVVLCCIAFLLHDMIKIFIVLLPLFYFISQYNLFKKQKVWFVIAIFSVCFSAVIRIYILPLLLSDRNAEMYLEGVWGTGSGVSSGFMLLCGWLNILIFIILYLLIIKNITRISNKMLLCLFLSSSVIVFACFGLWTIRERFAILSIITGCAIIITEWKNLAVGRLLTSKVVIFSSCLKFVLILFLHYSALFIHHSASNDPYKSVQITSRVLYVPTIFLLDVDNLGYSDHMYNKLYNRANYGE